MIQTRGPNLPLRRSRRRRVRPLGAPSTRRRGGCSDGALPRGGTRVLIAPRCTTAGPARVDTVRGAHSISAYVRTESRAVDSTARWSAIRTGRDQRRS
jgi:hypothetical protein